MEGGKELIASLLAMEHLLFYWPGTRHLSPTLLLWGRRQWDLHVSGEAAEARKFPPGHAACKPWGQNTNCGLLPPSTHPRSHAVETGIVIWCWPPILWVWFPHCQPEPLSSRSDLLAVAQGGKSTESRPVSLLTPCLVLFPYQPSGDLGVGECNRVYWYLPLFFLLRC